MIGRISRFIEKYRFRLLLAFTLIFLIIPSFFTGWFFYRFLTFIALTFIFIQSLFIISEANKKFPKWIIGLFILVLVFTWFGGIWEENAYYNFFRFVFYFVFFIFTIISLVKFMNNARKVTLDVVTVAVVIYLLIGLVGGSAAFFFYHLYPEAYHFTYPGDKVDLLEMTYYGFITMLTVGFGDIVPARPETRTLAYLMAVVGQLYLAIVIASIVAKYLSHNKVLREED